MNARQALINFHNHMVKTYGENYRDVWTEDDKITSETLERNASKAVTIRLISTKADTPIIRRIRGHQPEPLAVSAQERQEAWQALANKHGSGIIGKLSPIRNPYTGYIYEPPEYANAVAAPKFEPADVDSTNIFAYLMGN